MKKQSKWKKTREKQSLKIEISNKMNLLIDNDKKE